MSDKVRYFRGNNSGRLYTEAEVDGRSAVTEVQVVPLDAIVIRRNELPEVHVNENRGGADHGNLIARTDTEYEEVPRFTSPEGLRERARVLLALAEYLREHPPVDEAQVEAVKGILWEVDTFDRALLARRLVERGVRVEAKS